MKGILLCEKFYTQVVRPIVDPIFPEHGAGLIGPGSEVLGFDTEMSHDHNWYARCIVFTDGAGPLRKEIKAALRTGLPCSFEGFDVKADVCDARDYFQGVLGFDPEHIRISDWLSAPSQSLRELTGGAVFKSNDVLTRLRNQLHFYPRDLLLYILSAQWERIGQEMAFMGRCGESGDEIGSALLYSRLMTFIMRLCFLYEKQYAPYWKWFGTAFGKLKCADKLTPMIQAGMSATDWKEREKHLIQAYLLLGQVHNDAKLAPSVEPEVVGYYTRPFMVPIVEVYQRVLLHAIGDQSIKRLPPNIGAVDQITDQTDFLGHHKIRRRLQAVWEPEEEHH